MDGAIVLDRRRPTKISWANVQLMPDPTILSMETGTRHRTAERVSKQTKALVIAISQRRDVVSLYVEGIKYILQDIPTVLSKANQGLATLEKYRARLDQVAGAADRARVRRRRRPLRRALGAPARRAGHPDGRRGRALHHRARHRGPADRDAARGDRRRRDGRPRRARARLQRRATPSRRSSARSPSSPSSPHTELLDFGRLAELLGYDRKINTLDFPVTPRGYRALSAGSRGCRGWWRRRSSTTSATSTRSSRPRDDELAAVEGVGEARAKEIREGLRRLQEVDIVDRYR